MANPKLEERAQQKMQLVDDSGKPTGEVTERYKAHATPGKKHLAIQILVFNPNGELVLHRRSSRKIGGDTWDAPTTHVLAGETRDEAAWRCVEDEYGVKERIPLINLGGFSYERDYGDGTSENEFCLVSILKFGGEVRANAGQMHGEPICRKVGEVIQELKIKPNEYPPWFHLTMRVFLESPKNKEFK